jgi:hypothetical protein
LSLYVTKGSKISHNRVQELGMEEFRM